MLDGAAAAPVAGDDVAAPDVGDDAAGPDTDDDAAAPPRMGDDPTAIGATERAAAAP